MSAGILGWDIGGVNTKVARVEPGHDKPLARTYPFELQRDPRALTPLLLDAASQIGAESGDAHAVTMTAELSQFFRTKREGVGFVLDAVLGAFGEERVHVYSVDGRFLDAGSARANPLAVAASNWAATAQLVAGRHPNAILIDIGSTTADIIPIALGQVAAIGRTDPDRLASGELVYSGALRTPVEAITHAVQLRGASVGVSAEGFALAGDVHLWRGELKPADYTVWTPDGRPATRGFAGERLARIVCADLEMLDAEDIDSIAASVADRQIARLSESLRRVWTRHPSINTAVVAGLGDFLARAAAEQVGLHVAHLTNDVGNDASRAAPAAAVALLLADHLERLGSR